MPRTLSSQPAKISENEIEVTPEMIKAGVASLSCVGEDLSFRDLGPGDMERLVLGIVKAAFSAKKVYDAVSENADSERYQDIQAFPYPKAI